MSPEAFYGGALGGGKSDALLMAALQFVDFPGYAALLLRRTFAELNQENALMDRAHKWLRKHPGVKWSPAEHRYTFPSGATVRFGYMDTATDKYQYQSSEYQFIGFDEATEFTEDMYVFLKTRLRGTTDSKVPTRLRAASNPGGIGHAWVKERFIDGRLPFYRAGFRDNPHLKLDEYSKTLEDLPPLLRQQLVEGDWEAHEGGQFKPHWFKTYTFKHPWFDFGKPHGKVHWNKLHRFVTVDPACTPEDLTRKGTDPDYTVIGVYARLPWDAVAVLDVVRARLGLDQINNAVRDLCLRWDPLFVGYEAIAFQAALMNEAKRRRDIPNVKALDPRVQGKLPNIKMKLARATPAILWAEKGKIWIPEEALWKGAWLDEVTFFTGDDKLDAHDDQIDSLAYAVQEIQRGGFIAGTDPRPEPRNGYAPDLRPDLVQNSHAIRRNLYGVASQYERKGTRWNLSAV